MFLACYPPLATFAWGAAAFNRRSIAEHILSPPSPNTCVFITTPATLVDLEDLLYMHVLSRQAKTQVGAS